MGASLTASQRRLNNTNCAKSQASLFSAHATLLGAFLVASCIVLFGLLFCASFISANQATLEYANGSQTDILAHDAVNSTTIPSGIASIVYGAKSYFDNSLTVPDVYVRICHPNLAVNSVVDFVYYTESKQITRSVLNLPVQVDAAALYADIINNQSMNCAVVDAQFSSVNALYPGYIMPTITTVGTTYFVNNSMLTTNMTAPTFNGTMSSKLVVDAPPKSYWFSVPNVYDSNNYSITATRPLLLASVVSRANASMFEGVIRPNQILNYTGGLSGGERFVVNGITLFQIQIMQPCGAINLPGYYVMNQSMFNLNASCVNITNATDVKLNFGGELLDGDASVNGSFSPAVCGLTIKDSANITLEDVAVQQFARGICIINSSVTIFGTNAIANNNGLFVTDNSTVRVVQMTFDNYVSEINITNSSLVTLTNDSFASATVSGLYYDVWLNAVRILPTFPNITGLNSTNQFLEVKPNAALSWAQIGFNYGLPIPNHVAANMTTIYRYDGIYGTHSLFNNATNMTYNVTDWYNGNWVTIPTTHDASRYLWFNANQTIFSIYAPFGFTYYPPVPFVPVGPQNPPVGGGGGPGGATGGSAGPSGGSGGGGGGMAGGIQTPPNNFTEVVKLILKLPDSVTLMQGDAIAVPFSIVNLGSDPVANINIISDVPRGWKSSSTIIDQVNPGETIPSSFALSSYEKGMPADYYVPVSVIVDGNVVTSGTLKVSLKPRGNLTRLLITEYNPIIDILPNSELDVTFTAKNIGDFPLENVQILLAPNDCIKEITGSNDFAYGEEKNVTYHFVSGSAGNCQYTLKFVEGDKLVDFVPVTFQIRQLSFVEQTVRLMVIGLIVGVWFTVAIVIAFKKRRPPYQLPPSMLGGSGGLGGSYSAPNYSQYYRGN